MPPGADIKRPLSSLYLYSRLGTVGDLNTLSLLLETLAKWNQHHSVCVIFGCLTQWVWTIPGATLRRSEHVWANCEKTIPCPKCFNFQHWFSRWIVGYLGYQAPKIQKKLPVDFQLYAHYSGHAARSSSELKSVLRCFEFLLRQSFTDHSVQRTSKWPAQKTPKHCCNVILGMIWSTSSWMQSELNIKDTQVTRRHARGSRHLHAYAGMIESRNWEDTDTIECY